MGVVRKPRSLNEAQRLCERFAELDGQVKAMEAARDEAIAAANAAADAKLAEPLKLRDAIAEKLEPWFKDARGELLKGKRKSIELGGCVLGTRAGSSRLGLASDKDAIVASLKAQRWAKPYLRTSVSLDMTAVRSGLDGKHREKLKAAGLSIVTGAETFYISRSEQGGTQAKIG